MTTDFIYPGRTGNILKIIRQPTWGFALPGQEGSTISSCTQFSVSPGRTYNFQHWFITSAKYFQSAAVTGRRNTNSPAAQSPDRNTQAKDSASGSFHVCGVLTFSVSNTFRLCNVPLSREMLLPFVASVNLRFGQVERIKFRQLLCICFSEWRYSPIPCPLFYFGLGRFGKIIGSSGSGFHLMPSGLCRQYRCPIGFCFRDLFLEGGGAGFGECNFPSVNTCRCSLFSFLTGFRWTTERFSAFNSIKG